MQLILVFSLSLVLKVVNAQAPTDPTNPGEYPEPGEMIAGNAQNPGFQIQANLNTIQGEGQPQSNEATNIMFSGQNPTEGFNNQIPGNANQLPSPKANVPNGCQTDPANPGECLEPGEVPPQSNKQQGGGVKVQPNNAVNFGQQAGGSAFQGYPNQVQGSTNQLPSSKGNAPAGCPTDPSNPGECLEPGEIPPQSNKPQAGGVKAQPNSVVNFGQQARGSSLQDQFNQVLRNANQFQIPKSNAPHFNQGLRNVNQFQIPKSNIPADAPAGCRTDPSNPGECLEPGELPAQANKPQAHGVNIRPKSTSNSQQQKPLFPFAGQTATGFNNAFLKAMQMSASRNNQIPNSDVTNLQQATSQFQSSNNPGLQSQNNALMKVMQAASLQSNQINNQNQFPAQQSSNAQPQTVQTNPSSTQQGTDMNTIAATMALMYQYINALQGQTNQNSPSQQNQQINQNFQNRQNQRTNQNFATEQNQRINQNFATQQNQRTNQNFATQQNQRTNQNFATQQNQRINQNFATHQNQRINQIFPTQQNQLINQNFPNQQNQRINQILPTQQNQQLNQNILNVQNQQIKTDQFQSNKVTSSNQLNFNPARTDQFQVNQAGTNPFSTTQTNAQQFNTNQMNSNLGNPTQGTNNQASHFFSPTGNIQQTQTSQINPVNQQSSFDQQRQAFMMKVFQGIVGSNKNVPAIANVPATSSTASATKFTPKFHFNSVVNTNRRRTGNLWKRSVTNNPTSQRNNNKPATAANEHILPRMNLLYTARDSAGNSWSEAMTTNNHIQTVVNLKTNAVVAVDTNPSVDTGLFTISGPGSSCYIGSVSQNLELVNAIKFVEQNTDPSKPFQANPRVINTVVLETVSPGFLHNFSQALAKQCGNRKILFITPVYNQGNQFPVQGRECYQITASTVCIMPRINSNQHIRVPRK